MVICIVVFVFVVVVGLLIYFNFTQSGIEALNNFNSELKKADDRTNYNTQKEVEDTCRALIASYKIDRAYYETFINSTDVDLVIAANNAKTRAIKTANTYNEYILKNSFVWKENIPSDICSSLETNFD